MSRRFRQQELLEGCAGSVKVCTIKGYHHANNKSMIRTVTLTTKVILIEMVRILTVIV